MTKRRSVHSFSLKRRTLLKASGVAMGLPFLECMLGKTAISAPPQPLRYATIFAGQALGMDGVAPAATNIIPRGVGNNWETTLPLEPLVDNDRALRGDVSIISGLSVPDSLIPIRSFHGHTSSAVLSAMPSSDDAWVCMGPTADQLVADFNEGQTPFHSLVVRAQPSAYNGDFYGREFISYRGNGGISNRVEAHIQPQAVFEQLFGNFTPPAAGNSDDGRDLTFQQQSRKSVLDAILDKQNRLIGQVGYSDRIRLQEHFDSIRNIENQISGLRSGSSNSACSIPEAPPIYDYNNSEGWGDEDLRAKVFADLIHMAFTCDLVRSASLQITAFQSFANAVNIHPSLTTDVHEIGHLGAGGDPINVDRAMQWHVEFYAYLLHKLKQTPEGDGNLLDNSAIAFVTEGGHGIGLDDGLNQYSTHSVSNMMMLLGGRAGALSPGQHHRFNGDVQPGQVFLTAMNAVGMNLSRFGQAERSSQLESVILS